MDERARRRAVRGWVVYDVGAIAFSMVVLSLIFPLWITDDRGVSDAAYAVAGSAAMAAVFLAAPIVGARTDRAGGRIRWLAGCTLTAAAACALLGEFGVWTTLVLFAVANAAFQLGFVVYDALLVTVSDPGRQGRVSGYGATAGFGGALLGIAVGAIVLAVDETAEPVVFRITALLFVLLALPCLRWVREPAPTVSSGPSARPWAALAGSLRVVRETPGLSRFLACRLLYADAAGTTGAFMGIYASKELGYGDGMVQALLLSGVVAGPVGALGAGRAIDRVGPRAVLGWVLALWGIALGLAAAVPLVGLPAGLFWAVAPLVGVALGASGATDRTFVLRLTPPERVGRVFGVYAMVGRFAAIMGPLLWALIVDGLGLGRPVAVLSLAAMVAAAYAIVRPIRDTDLPALLAPGPGLPVTVSGSAGSVG